MDARYILLIQKQFDQPLSERETYEVQGFLAGNEAAAKLCENVRRLLEESENVELSEQFKPVDAEFLLTKILSSLTQTESQSWLSVVKQFVQGKQAKPQISSAHQDELTVLRKHKATAERSSKAMDALRAKLVAEVAPVTPEDAVSLAEAIKRRMLSVQHETEAPTEMQTSSAGLEQNPWIAPAVFPQNPAPLMMPLQFNNAPPPSISESMDQLFSSSNWPVITPETVRKAQEEKQEQKQVLELERDEPEFKQGPGPAPFASVLRNRFQQQQQQQQQPTAAQQRPEKNREHCAPGQEQANPNFEPETWPTVGQAEWSQFEPDGSQPAFGPDQLEPIWQLESAANQPAPIWQLEPVAHQPAPPSSRTITEPERLRPASLIPVDDIIAHVSHMFSEHIRDEAPLVVPPAEDPLGASSGSYPQIREIDLRKVNAARLATTGNTDESNGQIRALGNFLLDKQSVAAIGNLASANANLAHARILSDEEAQALQDCLSPIESLQGVAGCIILGYDGMIIMSSLPDHADKDALSAWALLTYINTHELVRVVGHSRLRQFVSRTLSGYLLLADFGQGLLLAVSDNASTEAILPLMKSVRRVTAA
ncbi:hypothetical protein BH10CYA1_BH10CYA1_19160 [soil metagenome]